MQNTTPTIRVLGNGKVATEPDVAVLSFIISEEDKEYGRAVDQLNARSAALREAVAKAGEDPKELKTTSFSITVNNDYDSGRYVFRGYGGTHSFQVRLPFDQQRLGKLFSAVTASSARAQLSISFTVSDPEAVKRRVLEAAVANAKERAEIIAAASGQKLGPILSVDYGYSEIRVSSAEYELASPMSEGSAPEIEPADVESEDTVRIVWELIGVAR
jgi:uncharacterized protein